MAVHLPSDVLLVSAELEKLKGRAIVVDNLYAFCLKTPEHRFCHCRQRLVTPKRALAPRVETNLLSDFELEIVAIHIGEVASADLGRHIPAVKRNALV